MAAALLAIPLFSSCGDDENVSEGSPVLAAEAVQPALFGDSITVSVNCTDESGTPLSTLKAQLCYGDEVVCERTLRTKSYGSYDVRLYAPYYKNIPDGTAEVRLTLQDISLAKAEQTVGIELSRPRYSYVSLVCSDGSTVRLNPDASDPYLFKGEVTSPSRSVNGYIATPKPNAGSVSQTFGLGTNGVTQGVQDNITFATSTETTFEAWFNVKTYEYGPVPTTPIITLEDADGANTYVGELTNGCAYEVQGSDEFAKDTWYYDPDFFTKNQDGTFTFTAMTGLYTVKADFTNKGFKVWRMADTENTATLAEDGTGAVWIIGSDCFGKPGYAQISGQGWWTDTDHALCMAPVKDKVYQVTFTIGKQLKADGGSINFKFFGQAGWGTEFKGADNSYLISTDSDIFAVGDGVTEHQGGHDNGNIYLREGVVLTEGDTYVLTVDLTEGVDKGKLTVVKAAL